MPQIKVLLADDEVGFTGGLNRVLTSRGFEVREAKDGLMALSLIGDQRFDVGIVPAPVLAGIGIGILSCPSSRSCW